MRTVREARTKQATLRLVEKAGTFVGLVIKDGKICSQVEGTDPDQVWQQMHHEHSRLNPQFFGYDGAISRFLKIFPEGFQSSAYLERERGYKVSAKKRLDETVPLALAQIGKGFGEKILSVFRATNLLSPFEKTRLTEVLRSESADSFVQGAAKFASGEITLGLNEMRKSLASFEVANWTAVTYLPYLWRPDTHMFLKPRVTTEFAVRVGHKFGHDYSVELSPRPNIFATLLGAAYALGISNVTNPGTWAFGHFLQVHRTPFAFLKAGCVGVCILDHRHVSCWLGKALGDIAVEDEEHGVEIEAMLNTRFDPRRILIPHRQKG